MQWIINLRRYGQFPIKGFDKLSLTVMTLCILIACKSPINKTQIEKIELDVWHDATISFLLKKCRDSNQGIYSKSILNNNTLKFSDSLNQEYFEKYLEFRITIKSVVDSLLINRNVSSIRIEEHHKSTSVRMRVILNEDNNQSDGIIIIGDTKTGISQINHASSRNSFNSYEKECLIATTSNVVSNITMVTDILPKRNYEIVFASIF